MGDGFGRGIVVPGVRVTVPSAGTTHWSALPAVGARQSRWHSKRPPLDGTARGAAAAEPIRHTGTGGNDIVKEQQPTYVSRVRVVRSRGPVREAYLPAEDSPVIFSTHGEVREHYGTAPGQFPERATTLDYVVAAAAG